MKICLDDSVFKGYQASEKTARKAGTSGWENQQKPKPRSALWLGPRHLTAGHRPGSAVKAAAAGLWFLIVFPSLPPLSESLMRGSAA